jgi:hypothetical protein
MAEDSGLLEYDALLTGKQWWCWSGKLLWNISNYSPINMASYLGLWIFNIVVNASYIYILHIIPAQQQDVQAGLVLPQHYALEKCCANWNHTNWTQNSHLKLYFLRVRGLTTSSYIVYDHTTATICSVCVCHQSVVSVDSWSVITWHRYIVDINCTDASSVCFNYLYFHMTQDSVAWSKSLNHWAVVGFLKCVYIKFPNIIKTRKHICYRFK